MKSADTVQGCEAMGAMGRDGTMEWAMWGSGDGRHGAPYGAGRAEGTGTMEPWGAGRAEGAERAERAGMDWNL